MKCNGNAYEVGPGVLSQSQYRRSGRSAGCHIKHCDCDLAGSAVTVGSGGGMDDCDQKVCMIDRSHRKYMQWVI